MQPVVDVVDVVGVSESEQSDEGVPPKDCGVPEMDKRYFGGGSAYEGSGVALDFDWLYNNARNVLLKIGKSSEKGLELGAIPVKPGQWHLCQKYRFDAAKAPSLVTSDGLDPELSYGPNPTSSTLSPVSSASSNPASSGTPSDDGLNSISGLVLVFVDI